MVINYPKAEEKRIPQERNNVQCPKATVATSFSPPASLPFSSPLSSSLYMCSEHHFHVRGSYYFFVPTW